MPKIVYNTTEIESTGKNTVNISGYIYVGRKYYGKQIEWIKLKDK